MTLINRRLSAAERIMYADGKSPLNCVFAVSLNTVPEPDAVRSALAALQRKHPLLRVNLREKQKGAPFFVTNAMVGPIPIRTVPRTGESHWQQETEKEWTTPFRDIKEPLMRVVWLAGDNVSDFILVCPHCICDGTTFTTLMREFLTRLDSPGLPEDPPRPPVVLQELLPPALSENRKLAFRARCYALLARFTLRTVLFLTPREERQQPPCYLLHRHGAADDSSSLIRACKSEKTSVHAALCAAFLLAFSAVRGKQARHKIVCPADIRRFLPQIDRDDMFAFAPVVELTETPGRNPDFWQIARSLKDQLTRKLAETDVPRILFMSDYFHSCISLLVRHMKISRGSHDLTLSNMGVPDIPERFGTFEIKALYSPSAGFPWKNPNTLVVSTYRGILSFSFISNEKFLPRNQAERIVEKALEILAGAATTAPLQLSGENTGHDVQ